MKYLIFFSVIFLLEMIKAYSQSDFRNGFIINNKNDTIYGLIDYKGNKANSKKCIFKKEINAEKQEFAPNEIKAYRFIDGKFYISKSIVRADKTDILFLEFLINGNVDVFYYRDDIGEHYFVETAEGRLLELINDEKDVIIDKVKYKRISKDYIGVLKNVFIESPSTMKKVDDLLLDDKSLITITRGFHNEVCSNEECIIYEKKLPKIITRFGPLLGVNSIFFSPDNVPDQFLFLRGSKFEKKVYPSLGFFFKINIPSFNEKFFFQYEGTFSHVKLTGSKSEIPTGSTLIYINDCNYLGCIWG